MFEEAGSSAADTSLSFATMAEHAPQQSCRRPSAIDLRYLSSARAGEEGLLQLPLCTDHDPCNILGVVAKLGGLCCEACLMSKRFQAAAAICMPSIIGNHLQTVRKSQQAQLYRFTASCQFDRPISTARCQSLAEHDRCAATSVCPS